MSTTEIVTNTLDKLASEINKEARLAEQHAMQAVNHALNAGRLLTEAKEQCPHGQWLPWMAENFEGSARTAQGYMRLFEHRDVLANTQRVAHLSVRDALKMLAEPQAVEPIKSWLPTDPDVLAILIFRHTVPGISDDNTPGEPEHPRLFVQRMGKTDPHWQYEEETPRYYAVFMEGGDVQYTKCPQPAWLVSSTIGQFAGGRFSKANKMVQALNMKFEDDAALRAHADLGWEYSDNSPNFVSALVDCLHPFNPMEW